MSIFKSFIDAIPSSVINFVGSIQYKIPFLRPLIQRMAQPFREGPRVLQHGVGAGLHFDPHGGNPGYALGTSGIEEQEALAHFLRPGNVFYDIGANKGFYAVIGAHLVGPQGHVYAFEPFLDSATAVRANAELNQQEHVTVFQAAVADQTKEEDLLLSGDSLEFSLISSLTAAHRTASEKVRVQVHAIDDLVVGGSLRPPDFIMIDVEGSEVDVLKGMRRTVEAHRPVVLCEVHWIREEFAEVLEDVFEPLGYTVTQLGGGAIPREVARYHALMLPPDRQ